MGETRELIGIYGAIDRAAAANDEVRAAVARLLPAYESDTAAGWFDEFESWTLERLSETPAEATAVRARRAAPRAPFPATIDEAMNGLARFRKPPPRMRARRLMAVGVAAQAFPDRIFDEGELLLPTLSVLQAQGLAPDDEKAREVLRLLGDESLLPRDGPEALDRWWDAVVESASGRGLIEDKREDVGPRPCTGKLSTVRLPGGDIVDAASLTTQFDVEKITFEQAIGFLEPSHWPACNDFWCQMAKVPGTNRYHEVVSTDCKRKNAAWTIQADLEFSFRRRPGFARAAYRMPPGVPQPDVLVDEGSLVVKQVGPRLQVTTTKRIRFTKAFSGEALALIMCALGYSSVAEDLVFSCAAKGDSGKAFPEDTPVNGGNGDTATSDADPARPPGAGSLTDDLIDEIATTLKACFEDGAHAVKDTLAKMAEGHYTADMAVQDAANTWVRLVRDSAKAVDIGIRAVARARESSES